MKLKPKIQPEPCVQCGRCCKQVTCWIGSMRGAGPGRCKFLKGDRPGYYYCELARKHPLYAELTRIGPDCKCVCSGCEDRVRALANNPEMWKRG